MDIKEFDKKLKEEFTNIHENINNRPGWYLGSLQIEKEFLECWNTIQNYYDKKGTLPNSFLEIGGFQGLWGVAFYVFSKLNGINRGNEYHTVTLLSHRDENVNLVKTVEYLNDNGFVGNIVDKNTMDDDVVDVLTESRDNFDIVFIDANHTYPYITNDINKFYNLANDMAMFHDIRPKKPISSISVYKALSDFDIKLDVEITERNSEGIGIKYIK